MTKEEIFQLRDSAEQTLIQFKERVTRENKYDISCEMVAQSNSHGGHIVVGINDKTGIMNPLSYQEVQETTNLLGSIATDSVLPSILIDTETVSVEGGNLVVATVHEGIRQQSVSAIWATRWAVLPSATRCGTRILSIALYWGGYWSHPCDGGETRCDI